MRAKPGEGQASGAGSILAKLDREEEILALRRKGMSTRAISAYIEKEWGVKVSYPQVSAYLNGVRRDRKEIAREEIAGQARTAGLRVVEVVTSAVGQAKDLMDQAHRDGDAKSFSQVMGVLVNAMKVFGTLGETAPTTRGDVENLARAFREAYGLSVEVDVIEAEIVGDSRVDKPLTLPE